jgi:hypothetical protein
VTLKLLVRLIATAAALVLLAGAAALAADDQAQLDTGRSRLASALARYTSHTHHGARVRSHRHTRKPKRHRRKLAKRHHPKAKSKSKPTALTGLPNQTPTSSAALTSPMTVSPLAPVVPEVPPVSEAPIGPTGPTGPTGPGGSTPEGCFADPEGCGYPGTQDTGVADCSALKPSGAKTITQAETVEGLDISGEVVVDARGVKLNDDCIEVDGNEEAETAAVILENGASDFTISNSTVRGLNTTTESIEEALRNNYSDAGAIAIKDRLEDCSECVHQTWTLDESYVDANGEELADESGRAHAEDWWFDEGTISADDDTLLNPSKQTAIIFAEGSSGECENNETVTNSLLAGGGYMLYLCAHSTGAGTSSIDIKDNRFARRVCAQAEIENYEQRGGFSCSPEIPEGPYFYYGEGAGGYFPQGGFFGVVYESEGSYDGRVGWEGNYWDNDLQPVEAP